MKRKNSLCPLTQSGTKRQAANQMTAAIQANFPRSISQPALRALAAAGFSQLEQLTETNEAELLKLHGMGPKAVGILRAALASRGLVFRT